MLLCEELPEPDSEARTAGPPTSEARDSDSEGGKESRVDGQSRRRRLRLSVCRRGEGGGGGRLSLASVIHHFHVLYRTLLNRKGVI